MDRLWGGAREQNSLGKALDSRAALLLRSIPNESAFRRISCSCLDVYVLMCL